MCLDAKKGVWSPRTKIFLLCQVCIEDDGKLLQQLRTGFKRSINWNKYKVEQNNKINGLGHFNMVDPCI